MEKYRITYSQKFMGQTIRESYIKTVSGKGELEQAVNALYCDPHVFKVVYRKVEDEK